MKNKKGFTLVELLVVIAIIGILSSVAVVNLNSARDKAKVASAQAALSGLTPAFIVCQDSNLAITDPTAQNAGGGAVCAGSSATWPNLPTGYIWSNSSISGAAGGSTFFMGASTTGALANVFCSETGCGTL